MEDNWFEGEAPELKIQNINKLMHFLNLEARLFYSRAYVIRNNSDLTDEQNKVRKAYLQLHVKRITCRISFSLVLMIPLIKKKK